MSFKLYSTTLKRVLNRWPGKQYFGVYRFLPLFFLLGASLEYSMINWQITPTNRDRPRTLSKQKYIHIKMPAGVSWSQYLKFFTAAMLTMLAGSQVVHIYYRPLDDIDKYVEEEKMKHKLQS